MKYSLNGLELNIQERGNGLPAIIFLHYWGGSSRTWADVIAALPGTYRTIAPDLRGWGESSATADNGFALIDFVNDILAMITALDVRHYVLVGHSMGGENCTIAGVAASPRTCWAGTDCAGAADTDEIGSRSAFAYGECLFL
ncbi:alpha/beta fold hydrolase [Acerihabitans sp. KWT182]|uniref:Alpha/beta fold hydrolase n=1 Tax=Acerihabitans sp. KWT182 TaxID=3157919 RepID=A0AAU7QAE6_9GAMM